MLTPSLKFLDPTVPEAQLTSLGHPYFLEPTGGGISSLASEMLLTQSLICIIS